MSSATASPPEAATTTVDAVVIGAGFSGLYMLHELRNQMGLRARVFEMGDGAGGTWYWNRYPGARSDSDSYIYGFTFDKELWEEWECKPRQFMPNLDFVGPCRAKCDQIAENGWEGFAVDGVETPAGEHVYQWVLAG